MQKPTREDLIKLLFTDPASEAFEAEGLAILEEYEESGAVDQVAEVMTVVGSEVGDPHDTCDSDESEHEALRSLACGAKRGAILLLVAAWHAERAATDLEHRAGERLAAADRRQLTIPLDDDAPETLP